LVPRKRAGVISPAHFKFERLLGWVISPQRREGRRVVSAVKSFSNSDNDPV
jgi:hypothetical protein